jgi:hypothetical protein
MQLENLINMLFGKKDLYKQTRKIKIGRAKLSPIFNELKEWVNDEYGINVINIVYDEIDIGSHKRRSTLNLIVETLFQPEVIKRLSQRSLPRL